MRQFRKFCFVTLLCLFLSFVYFKYLHTSDLSADSEVEKPTIIYLPKIKTNLSCYYSTKNDALPSVEDPSFTPGDKPIFFHETSCRGGIDSRQACAVESAARLHPKWQINLIFNAPVSEHILKKSILVKLLEFPNVKLARVHIEQYGKGTAVEQTLKHTLKKSSHPIEHASDLMRVLTLNKFGGVYLDTDSILVRSLDSLPLNWIAKESDAAISAGAMAFTTGGIGGNVTRAMLKELKDSFLPKAWSHNGPKAFQRVLTRMCPKEVKTGGDCKGLKILLASSFYPIHYRKFRMYFKNGSVDKNSSAYMHHMWNYLTRNLKIGKNSLYAKLAEKYCPMVYRMYGNRFGD